MENENPPNHNCELRSLLWQSLDASSSNPGIANAWFLCKIVIGLTYVVSLLTNNYSQTDKLWSITPVLYAWLLLGGGSRTLLLAILATIWGIRLTYNFNRRGGYQWPPWTGEEDYRWSYLQKGHRFPALKNRVIWHIFNAVFISAFQNILLLSLTLPSMVAYLVETNVQNCFPKRASTTTTDELNIWDIIASVSFLVCLVFETIADNQQYAFQTEKYRLKQQGNKPLLLVGEYKDGFLQSGLFAWMRKPNYTGEQGVWISFYFFSVASLWSVEGMRNNSMQCYFNVSMVGCILLMVLFQGSGPFTEQITISKYPRYVDYQKRVPLYLPTPFSYTKSKDL